jgi:hypothetical protein
MGEWEAMVFIVQAIMNWATIAVQAHYRSQKPSPLVDPVVGDHRQPEGS